MSFILGILNIGLFDICLYFCKLKSYLLFVVIVYFCNKDNDLWLVIVMFVVYNWILE